MQTRLTRLTCLQATYLHTRLVPLPRLTVLHTRFTPWVLRDERLRWRTRLACLRTRLTRTDDTLSFQFLRPIR